MKTALRYTIYTALFALLFLPLYVANNLFFPFITGKGFLFRILVEVAAVAYIGLALADRKYRPRFSWILVLYSAFTFWMLIADLLAINSHKALWSNYERMDGWVTLIHVFLFFVVAGSVLSADKLWRKWWLTSLSVSALVCGYSLLQLGGSIDIHQGGVRVDASFGNAIYLAVYLMFSAFIAAWLAAESKGWLRYSLMALIALQVIILFNTATRGAIIAIVAGAAFAAVLFTLKSGKQARRIGAGALAALLIAIGGFWLVRDSAVVKDSPIFSRIASISLDELTVRFTLWDMAVDGIQKRPIFGYGQEGFNYIFNSEYRPSLYAQEPWFDRAHNAYVDWLVAGGIPALLLFLALLIAAFIAVYRDKDASRVKRIFLTSALAAYALQAIVVFDNLFSYLPLAAILAMAHAGSARPFKKLDALPAVSRQTLEAVVAPVSLVAAVALIWVVNVPGMKGAGDLVQAISPQKGGVEQNLSYFKEALADNSYATQEIREQLVIYAAGSVAKQEVSGKVKGELVSFAVEEMQKEIARAPQDARLYMQNALVFRAINETDLALSQIDAAIALSPKKQQFYIERGLTLTSGNRMNEGRDAFYAAYKLNPEYREGAAYAASGDIYAGDIPKAKALLQEVFGTTTVSSNALVRAYYETKHYDDLIAVLKLQVAESTDADNLIRLASGYAVAGRYAEARVVLAELVQKFPQAKPQADAMLASFPK